jgi:hypothetical protein
VTAATPADWAAALSLGLSAAGLIAFALSFADADVADFDPRPAVRAVHQVAVHAGHDLNRAIATSQRLAREIRHETSVAVTALFLLPLLSAPTATEARS